jgi:hypothetical protein
MDTQIILSPPLWRTSDAQGALRDSELEGFGLSASNTRDWNTCPNTPTAGPNCCVGGTVG